VKRAEFRFNAVQRRELEDMELGETQIGELQAVVPLLSEVVRARPAAQDVKDTVAKLNARAKKNVVELRALIDAKLPAAMEAASILAFYLDKPRGYVRIEPAKHPDPASVLECELQRAEDLCWATAMVAEEMNGAGQVRAAWLPISLIDSAVKRGTRRGDRQVPVSYGEGKDFRRIVAICMGAAGGNPEQAHERAIRAYIAMQKGTADA
jgi:hypothetical protein